MDSVFNKKPEPASPLCNVPKSNVQGDVQLVVSTMYERKRVFITARTYPSPARKGIEVSCTGGITEQGEWIRLFPVPWRLLSQDKRFRKYQWIEVTVKKAPDPRPESFLLDIDSINILGDSVPTTGGWAARKLIVSPLQAHCLCCLHRTWREERKPTLGFFKPKSITEFVIEADTPTWTPGELAKLRQHTMFQDTPLHLLEKIPYKFSYKFFCDEPDCNGHKLSCVDWELGEAYRKWRVKYGNKWEWAIRNRFETEMITKLDTHFFVGTVAAHPSSWIIVGLFYPPMEG